MLVASNTDARSADLPGEDEDDPAADHQPEGAVDSPLTLTGAALSRPEAEVLAGRLRVVAEPTRLMLLSMIHAAPDGEASVGDLAAPIGLTQPTVSYHLRALTEAGLVNRDRRGTWVFYSLVPGALQQVRDILG